MNKLIVVSAIVLLAVFAGIGSCAEQIVIMRAFENPCGAGEVFEVTLSVDVSEEDKPLTYILSEEVPEGFEIVDTDAKVTATVMDEDTNHTKSVMKWVVIEGLFGGKVEDVSYVYHLRAPEVLGEYALRGNALLKDKSRVDVGGVPGVSVVESDGNSMSGRFTFAHAAPLGALIVVLSFVVVYFTKKRSAGNVAKS